MNQIPLLRISQHGQKQCGWPPLTPCKNYELDSISLSVFYTTQKLTFKLHFNWRLLSQFKTNFSDANLTSSIYANSLWLPSLLIHLVFKNTWSWAGSSSSKWILRSEFQPCLRTNYGTQDEGHDFALKAADERKGLAVCHTAWKRGRVGDWESELSLTCAYLQQ